VPVATSRMSRTPAVWVAAMVADSGRFGFSEGSEAAALGLGRSPGRCGSIAAARSRVRSRR